MSVVRKAGLVVVLVLAMLTPAAPAPAVPPTAAPVLVSLSVMSQNTFYGGDDFDLATSDWCPTANGCPAALHRLAHVIEVSGADVVGVQEPERNTGRLARLLGWYADPRAHVVSRFPILDPGDADGLYTFVMPIPGRVVAVANIHLPSTPYGPYQVRKGWSHAEVLRLERDLRLKALAPVLRVLPKLAERGIPVFLTGDFNSPSHLDWTPAVAVARDDVPYAVAWPASRALADAGFGDSYRDAHPDPVADPGYTWSPGGPETRPHDFPDRIDWVLHAGPVTTVSSRLVGERGNPQVDLAFAKPYPTDHRGVVSQFRVQPSPVREIASPEHRRVTVGPQRLAVRFHSRGDAGEVVAFQRRAGAPLLSARSTGNRPDGVVRLSKSGLAPGRYDVVLARDGRVLSRTGVWLYARGAGPTLRTDRSTYAVGDDIRVRWTGAPGTQLDWIGLMRCAEVCPGPGSYLAYRYTRTRIEGSVRFGADTYLGEGSASWPLPPGRYIARLMDDDSYHAIGKSQVFTVVR
jgi:endonuclease/exonuclease/phosphatase family metal-dependent hydrolase